MRWSIIPKELESGILRMVLSQLPRPAWEEDGAPIRGELKPLNLARLRTQVPGRSEPKTADLERNGLPADPSGQWQWHTSVSPM